MNNCQKTVTSYRFSAVIIVVVLTMSAGARTQDASPEVEGERFFPRRLNRLSRQGPIVSAPLNLGSKYCRKRWR